MDTLASAAQRAAQTGMTVRETQMVGMEAANDRAQSEGGDPNLGREGGRPRIAFGRDLPARQAG